jgi:16S rRNA (guanine1207-N2)-methyltransferase
MASQHYFSKEPASAGGRRVITDTVRSLEVRLVTEAGVFSRERIDVGTRLLIKHLEVRPTDRVLDLGCGYGAVGVVVAALASEGQVTLVDINQRAVALAQENLILNGIHNAQILQGDGFTPVAGQAFDLIALNPPIRAGLRVIHPLLEQAREHLTSAGRFYLVGRTRQGVVRLAEKMRSVFGNVEEVAKGGGYRVYLSRRSE